MISLYSTSSPTLSKSCQCPAQLFRGQMLSRGPCRTGKVCHMNQQSRQVALVCAVPRKPPPVTSSTTKAKSQAAEQNAQYSNAPRLISAASFNLVQALAGSAISQGFKQLQNTYDQLQQTGNKLTKGFSPRPLGFPPGAALAVCLAHHLALQAGDSPLAANEAITLTSVTIHFVCTTVLCTMTDNAVHLAYQDRLETQLQTCC